MFTVTIASYPSSGFSDRRFRRKIHQKNGLHHFVKNEFHQVRGLIRREDLKNKQSESKMGVQFEDVTWFAKCEQLTIQYIIKR